MKLNIILIYIMLLIGCTTPHQKTGTLSQMKEFQVAVFFSPYENYDRKQLLTEVEAHLKEHGTVHSLQNINFQDKAPILCISLGGYHEPNTGSIQVITEVEVLINKAKTACSIWKWDFYDKATAVMPVVEDGKISFKQDLSQANDLNQTNLTPEFVIKQLIEEFAKKYQEDNPAHSKITFTLIPSLLQDQ